jgi:deoxyadenosine/deoxycytidine kinase
VHGGVGVGKSSYLQKYIDLQQDLIRSNGDPVVLRQTDPPADVQFKILPQDKALVLKEPVELWKNFQTAPEQPGVDLLQGQYSNPNSGAFELQTFIRNTFFDLHLQPCHVPVRIMERSIHAAEAFVDRSLMTPIQFQLERCWQQSCRSYDLLDEDLIINLYCSEETALYRIKRRGRPHEKISCTDQRLKELKKRIKEQLLDDHPNVVHISTEQIFYQGFNEFCDVIHEHYLRHQRDPDAYVSFEYHGYSPVPPEEPIEVPPPPPILLSEEALRELTRQMAEQARTLMTIGEEQPSTYDEQQPSTSGVQLTVDPAWIPASPASSVSQSSTPTSSSSASSFSSILMQTLPEQTAMDEDQRSDTSDPLYEVREYSDNSSQNFQDSPAVSAPPPTTMMSSDPTTTIGHQVSTIETGTDANMDDLSSLLQNLEVRWPNVQQALERKQPNSPEALKEEMKSPALSWPIPQQEHDDDSPSIPRPVRPSSRSANQTGARSKISFQRIGRRWSLPWKQVPVPSEIAHRPVRFWKPSPGPELRRKIVKNVAIQESNTLSLQLQEIEYELPVRQVFSTKEQETSISIHEILEGITNPNYKEVKRIIYQIFVDEPLRPYGQLAGSWDRILQIDLNTQKELTKQLKKRTETFPYVIIPTPAAFFPNA